MAESHNDTFGKLAVQVCYAKPGQLFLRDGWLPPGATIQDAIAQSGVLNIAPEINPLTCRVGIFGKLKSWDTVLRDKDRVEIYRPLIADPKDSRRQRATKKTTKQQQE